MKAYRLLYLLIKISLVCSNFTTALGPNGEGSPPVFHRGRADANNKTIGVARVHRAPNAQSNGQKQNVKKTKSSVFLVYQNSLTNDRKAKHI